MLMFQKSYLNNTICTFVVFAIVVIGRVQAKVDSLAQEINGLQVARIAQLQHLKYVLTRL